MAVYVDKLRNWGWKYGASCHMITDGQNEELHEFALKIGLKRAWFQATESGPHYDLTSRKRALAVKMGAIELDDRPFHAILNKWSEAAIARIKAAKTTEEAVAIREDIFR